MVLLGELDMGSSKSGNAKSYNVFVMSDLSSLALLGPSRRNLMMGFSWLFLGPSFVRDLCQSVKWPRPEAQMHSYQPDLVFGSGRAEDVVKFGNKWNWEAPWQGLGIRTS